MLINSVLAFTRELLPVFILIATVLQLPLNKPWRLLLQSTALGAIATLCFTPLLGNITQWFDGNGLELLFMLLQLVTLAALVLALYHRRLNYLVTLAISAQMSLAGINLLLFVLTVSSAEKTSDAIWLGAVLGLGIGSSICVLLYQVLFELRRFCSVVIVLMLALTGARQTSEIIALLAQTDWLTLEQKLWDSSVLLHEQTEIGVFFHALFGYEATPDAFQLAGWLITLTFMLGIGSWRRAKQ
ncbi:MAG: hypothetical protein KKE94_06385 [Gammaproteobacteria bacterium]|nr:hypothetical protein [Gammaproteobacteria bacterium]